MISKNRLKHIQSLHLKKFRLEHQCFIAEGVKVVNEFIGSAAYKPLEVFATVPYLNAHHKQLEENNIPFTEVSEDELKKISLQSTPNQVLAICPMVHQKLDAVKLHTHLNLFLDDIKDPGNLGTIIRIADWFGIPQVICSPTCAELYNIKTIQATMGAMLRVPVIYENFGAVLKTAPDVTIYGAVMEGINVYKTRIENGILVIGNEANGISDDVLSHVNRRITIPPAGNNGSESLNAAVATAILCNEHARLHVV
ncbi:MAG: RNA methyltransferase [Bacteroidetes bacterium]|nr:RNA methyltransferase [Bacteroidota bacterium]